MQNTANNILQNIIEQIKKKTNVLQIKLSNLKKDYYLKKDRTYCKMD